jgi:lipopolysaccharide export system permease protein
MAASIVKDVAIRAALYRLESPVEPGTFNSEISDFTVYVRSGDIVTGRWLGIFVYNEDKSSGLVRLITSETGRVDSDDENSELVLKNATVTSFSIDTGLDKFISEKVGETRIAVRTRRGELVERLASAEPVPEEMGMFELASYAASKQGKERLDAEILWQRRTLLSIASLLFVMLGTSLVLRYNRGGKGFGILIAIAVLIGFYLLAFLGEQLARTSLFPVFISALLPIVGVVSITLWFNLSGRFALSFPTPINLLQGRGVTSKERKVQRRNLLVDVTTGLRDFDLAVTLVKYFALTIVFLGSVFLIFTAFELWRFAGTIEGGVWLLLRYLLFLLPFVYLQLAPSAAMIAVLATYVIKSRQNEIVTWTAAGQSIYRLLVPGVVFALIIGFANWQFEERVAPLTNKVQDSLRNQIRGQSSTETVKGRTWIADGERIISFINTPASDNANPDANICLDDCPVSNIQIFELSDNGANLQKVYRAKNGVLGRSGFISDGGFHEIDLRDGTILDAEKRELKHIPFTLQSITTSRKPSQMDIASARAYAESSRSLVEKRVFLIAVEKKYSNMILPFVITLFTAPFALSLSRKGKVVTITYAVGLWFLFVGVSSIFEQLGQAGTLGPKLAVWAPLCLFTLLGLLLMSRVRT